MGFQGQLSSVQLADLFQTFFMNRQTGTLSVVEPHGTVHVYFDQGLVALCTAPLVDNQPFLLTTLVRKGLLAPDHSNEVHQRLKSSGQPLRELLLTSGYINEADLDEISIWCVEEMICPLFELPDGNFTFTDGDPVQELMAADVLEMGAARLPTQQIIMEATRRTDEWKRIREIIPDSEALFVVDNEGRSNLRNIQTDPEMLKVLRYLDGRHSLDSIANAVGATRFDTHAIVAQMVLSGVARPQTPQDVVIDAMALKEAGELTKARELLEHALKQARMPEVMRPLADVCAQLGQAARAVELFLELIQTSQDQGNLDQALADLDIVIGLSPDDPELHFERAQVRAEKGEAEEAAAGYVIAAQAFLSTKDVPRALDACHRAKNLLPRSPEPHRYLAKAYLMEGQTENAVVEYKALWHALLTSHRPRQALDELRSILDSDCKFAAIKEQILSHAQSSEAIKTSKAMRTLVYVLVTAVIGVSAVVGWEYYDRVFYRGQGQKKIAAFEQGLARRQEQLDHQAMSEELGELRRKYGPDAELRGLVDSLDKRVKDDYETRGRGVLERGKALLDGGEFAKAETCFQELIGRYQGTEAANRAPTMIEQVRSARITTQVQTELAEAERRWQSLEWDGAHEALTKVLSRRDLPNALRAQLTEKQVSWAASIRSSQPLFERAAKIEQSGDLRLAIVAYRRAAAGEGEQYANLATDHLRTLELTYAGIIGKQFQDSANRGEDAKAFTAYDEIVRLAAEGSGDGVKNYLARLDVPYALQLDTPLTTLTVRRGSQEIVVKAPAGTTTTWVYRLTYHPGEVVTLLASRPGFTTQSGTIAVGNRRAAGVVHLVRGPRWKTDLSGPATTKPIIAGDQILVGTGKATLEIIDPRQGANRAVTFPDTVAEFRAPPVVFQDRAYVVIEDTLFAVGLATRNRQWSWPTEGGGSGERQLTGSLLVQEHDLIQGTLLIVASTAKDGVTFIGADTNGHVTIYPFTSELELTGAPGADHLSNRTLVYLPFGNQLLVTDATESTEQRGPKKLYTLRTRGDLVGRPIRVLAGPSKRPAMLIGDSSGLVIAVDGDPNVPETKRIVGTWPIDGTQPSTPIVDDRNAYVTVAEGRVNALDLDHPGQLRWRFPSQGSLGSAPGEPAVGKKGIYVASANGVLLCLDRATGRERWRCDLGSPAVGGVIADNGMVFVALRSGQLWGFDEGDD